MATRLFEIMAREAMNFRLVSISEIEISVLVKEEKLERAVRALHTTYELSVQD